MKKTQKKNKLDETLFTTPKIARKICLTTSQKIGMPIILLIPLLSLLGFFGESKQSVSASTSQYKISVQYPNRLRYHQPAQMEVWIENLSEEDISDLNLKFSTDYLQAFSDLSFLPAIREPYLIALPIIPAKEKKLVQTIDMLAEKYGAHSGTVEVESRVLEKATLPLNSFIFP